MKFFLNTAINDDIQFVAAKFYEAVGAEDVYLTTGNDGQASGGFVRRRLFVCAASSLRQVFNIAIVVFYFTRFRLCGGRELYVLAPSVHSIYLLLLARLVRVDVKALVHDVVPHYAGARGVIYDLQNKIIFKFASAIYVFSNFSKQSAEEVYSHADVRVLCLPTPIETFEPDRGVVKDYDLVWWGRLEAYKGADRLPEIARKASSENLRLLVISQFDGADQILSELKLNPSVTVVDGFLSLNDLAHYLQSTVVNFCPYTSATQSGVISFCACIGVPSIAYDVGALGEQVNRLLGEVVGETAAEWRASVDRLKDLPMEAVREAYLAKSSSRTLINQVQEYER